MGICTASNRASNNTRRKNRNFFPHPFVALFFLLVEEIAFLKTRADGRFAISGLFEQQFSTKAFSSYDGLMDSMDDTWLHADYLIRDAH